MNEEDIERKRRIRAFVDQTLTIPTDTDYIFAEMCALIGATVQSEFQLKRFENKADG